MQKRWSPVYIALSIGLGVVALVCTFSYASGTQGGRVLASQNVADYCSARNGVQTVSVPLYPERPDSPSFPLAYKLFRSPDSNAPTIIVIPGGPGDTLLDHSPAETYPYGALTTEHFNILYTDPRGLGCNEPAGADFPADAYRTEYLANDVTQIIRELKLDHYFIYGASFGTVVATYAARRTVEVGLNAPRAVILEGTLGRGFKGRFDEYISGFTHEWDRVKKLISNAISSRLATNPLPFGYSGEVWGQYVFKKMITGEQPGYGPLIQYYLKPLLTQDGEGLLHLRSDLQQIAELLREPPSSRVTRIFRTIGCRELFGAWKTDVTLKNGQLVGEGSDLCEGIPYRPYDSAQVAIPAPVFYFQGPFDPATPYASARYHFANQVETQRTFVTVSGASHAPLSLSLRALGCSESIWSQISADPNRASLDFSKCGTLQIDQETRGNL